MAQTILLKATTTPFVLAHRVRFRDRLSARLRAYGLDRALAAGVSPDASAPLELRARRLLDRRIRNGLGRSARRIARTDAAGSLHRVTASGADAQARKALDQLARRLLAPAPVDARGVARARILLGDGTGPLFRRDRAQELKPRLREAIEALEPGR